MALVRKLVRGGVWNVSSSICPPDFALCEIECQLIIIPLLLVELEHVCFIGFEKII